MTLHTKLLEIQKKLLKFGKNGDNPFFKSKYLTLDHLLEVLLPVLNEYDILVYHITKDWNVETHVTDGENEIISSFPITNLTDPQKVGSIISYGRRYNLGQIFNIVTDVDDDGNKASVLEDKKEETKPSFTKPRFWKEQLDNLVKDVAKSPKKYEWLSLEKLLARIDAKRYLGEDQRWFIEEFYNRNIDIADQVATSVEETFNK